MKSGVVGVALITLVGLGLLIAAAFLIATPAYGTDFTFDGQVRVRVESFDRSFKGQTATSHVFQRARFAVKAVVSEDTEAFFQVQDARVWGFEPATLSNTRNADLYQAWGQWKYSGERGDLRFRGGRQALSYGNQRIIGAVGWSNLGRSFDALHTRYSKGGWTGDVVLSRIRDQRFNQVTDFNDDLYFTYHQYQFADTDMRLEGYLLYRNDRSDKYELTPGAHYDGKTERLHWDAEITGMFGRRAYRDLQALLASGQVHFVVVPDKGISLGGGVDYLSGDDPNTEEDEFFSVLRIFHTGHKFYGFMDVAPVVAGRAGLIDPYLVLKMKGKSRFSGIVAAHFFMVDQPGQFTVISSGMEETSRNLGTELDAKLYLQVATRSQISIGGALFLPGDVLKNQERESNAIWGYAQALLNF